MMMCFGVFLFGTLCASWTSWKSISFARLGTFAFIICLNKFSISYCCSSPSGTPIIQILEQFQVVPEVCKTLFTFLNSCFFILFLLDVYFFLLFQIIDLSPGFLPVTVGSLNILLYFIFGYLSCVFSFFDQAQSDL